MSNYAIYKPKGKAGEYSEWACNFYVGCSNGCTYCYLKKGRGAKIMGGDVPTLKKCFKDENHALEVFKKELKANLSELQKHGLFFSFTTDPMLKETIILTLQSAIIATKNHVPVKILTKRADWVDELLEAFYGNEKLYAFGFTLTGHDELETGASPNTERIEAMKKIHEAGFKTFASIEPIINLTASADMITRSCEFCDLFKVGLLSSKKYDKFLLQVFIKTKILLNNKFYFKESLLKQAGIERESLPDNCVSSDYNLFTGGNNE